MIFSLSLSFSLSFALSSTLSFVLSSFLMGLGLWLFVGLREMEALGLVWVYLGVRLGFGLGLWRQ
jgi:hypothetical protein